MPYGMNHDQKDDPNPFAPRYGNQPLPPAPLAPWNAVLDTLLAHRSVRRYSPQALPPGLLELLVAAAQSAPSSSNLQAFSIVAVEDPDRKRRLAALAAGQRHVAEAPAAVDVHCRPRTPAHGQRERGRGGGWHGLHRKLHRRRGGCRFRRTKRDRGARIAWPRLLLYRRHAQPPDRGGC